MRTSNQAPILLVLLLVLLGGAAWFALDGEPDAPGEDPITPVALQVETEPERPAMGVRSISLPSARTGEAEPSTVLWPLEVDLTLMAPGDVPRAAGHPALGAGANARLRGRVGDRKDRGAPATVTFLHGANEGRVLHTDSEGRFGATDLYPGLSIVSIQGHGLVGAEREVRLRQRSETVLNIGFGRLGTVQGTVLDEDEEPVFGAKVTVDGHAGQTDENGRFYIPSLASGHSHILIEKPGYASHRERIGIVANQVIAADRLKYVLKEGATLTLTVTGGVGGPGPVQVWLNPGSPKRQRTYPFYQLNPIELAPGERRELTDLPRELLKLQAWRVGAQVYPPTRNVNLSASRRLPLELELRDTPRLVGRVLSDGEPVRNARVVLEAPDQVQAALRTYRQPAMHLESSVLPMPPNALQEVRTNASGEYTLSHWTDNSSVRYLWAESEDGGLYGVRLVESGEERVDLHLLPRTSGAGRLTLDVGARYQGLPVTWRLNGQPGEPFDLPTDEALTFEGLRPGTWKVEVRWYADELLSEDGVEVLDGEGADLALELPEGALNGQDRESWERAGRDWPLL